jgi:hypothetical protein
MKEQTNESIGKPVFHTGPNALSQPTMISIIVKVGLRQGGYLRAVGVSSKDAPDIPAGWPELIERQVEFCPQNSDQLDH